MKLRCTLGSRMPEHCTRLITLRRASAHASARSTHAFTDLTRSAHALARQWPYHGCVTAECIVHATILKSGILRTSKEIAVAREIRISFRLESDWRLIIEIINMGKGKPLSLFLKTHQMTSPTIICIRSELTRMTQSHLDCMSVWWKEAILGKTHYALAMPMTCLTFHHKRRV